MLCAAILPGPGFGCAQNRGIIYVSPLCAKVNRATTEAVVKVSRSKPKLKVQKSKLEAPILT